MSHPYIRAARDGLLGRFYDGVARRTAASSLESADRFGRRLGVVGWALARRERRRTLDHLQLAFPGWDELQRERVGKEVFAHQGANLADVMRVAGGGLAELLGGVEWRGLDELRRLHAEGRGVVLGSAHAGNWEVIQPAVIAAGLPFTVVVRATPSPTFDVRARALRQAYGVEVAVRGAPETARRLLRTLKDGGILGLAIDQDIEAQGAFVPFFGRPAWTPTGAAVLAIRRQAPLVPVLTRRIGPGRHLIEVHAPIEPPEQLDREEASVEMTRALTALTEEWIRQAPEQWVWMHRRWRRRPEAEIEGLRVDSCTDSERDVPDR